MNLLLIHSLVKDQKTVIDSLTENTRYIIIDYFEDDLQNIKDKISAFNLSFERIGLFQENDNRPYYQLTRKFQRSTLIGVESQDSNLDTWTEFIDLLNFCKNLNITNLNMNNLNMTNLDIMDCNVASNKNWDYIIRYIENKLKIDINASSNETGNSAMQGDWILERGNVNLIGTYFIENIKEYKYTLGGAGGLFYTMILNNKNEVYGCGDNQFGQLGNNSQTDSTTLVPMRLTGKIPTGRVVVKIACGDNYTIVLLDDGTVYGCGANGSGQLGIGNTVLQTTLVPMTLSGKIPSGKKVVNISCGSDHTIILLDDGTVYGCGNNEYGQLGNGTKTSSSTLVQMTLTGKIPSGKKVVNIECGVYHTIVLLDDYTVYGCGNNDSGQLGNGESGNGESGNRKTTLVPMILSGKIPIGKKVVNIACGFNYTIVLLDDYTVYGCGNNEYGQLGNGESGNTKTTLVPMTLSGKIPTGKKVVNIACGDEHTIVLLDDYTVYGCGSNYIGQLGIGNTNTPQPTLVQMTLSGKKVINIACGVIHTIVFLDDGTVYGCGANGSGQLGNGNTQSPQITLVQMKYYNNDDPTNPINVTDSSTATFSTIFFNPSAITKTYDGNTNITLTPSMYEIYTYNPLQPTITINMYTANFNNKNIGTNKTVNITINKLKDNKNNTNYLFVIPYNTSGNITALPLSQYISRYTTLKSLSKLEVKETNTAAYAVIGYKSKKIDPLFSVFLQNL